MARKKTPDVMSTLLPTSTASKSAPPATAKKHAGKPGKQQASKTAKRQDSKPDEPPIKVTYYLSPEILEALELAQIQLRKHVGRSERGKISKSLIVEQALQLALDDWDTKKGRSRLAKVLG